MYKSSKNTFIEFFMKKLFLLVLVLISRIVVAQEDKGIKFQHNLTWTQIKQKAKNENKYIFMDAFTTWCLPCKIMSNEIFPQPNVANFFNTNFINVAVQFDVTKKDDDHVKSWYKDVEELRKAYKVDSYPTYLFYNPQGELVHSVYGASKTSEEFITKSKDALDPKKQYLSLKQQYSLGNKQPNFLLILLKSAIQNRDKELIPKLSSEYFATQKDLLIDDNLKILATTTLKSSDIGFPVFRNNAMKADLILGIGKSAGIIRTILFDEIALKYLRSSSIKTNYGGGMVVYSGTLNQKVEWDLLKAEFDSQYPELSEEVFMFAKISYFEWAESWPEYSLAVSEFHSKHKDRISTDDLNQYAGIILRNTDDEKSIKSAINWAKENMDNSVVDKKLMCLYTYSNLLYKSGDKNEAIKLVGEAIELTSGKDIYFVKLLDKMKKGEKTW